MSSLLFWPTLIFSFEFSIRPWPWSVRASAAPRTPLRRWTFALLCLFLGYVQVLQYILSTSMGQIPLFGWTISSGSSLLFPLSLTALLYLRLLGRPVRFRGVFAWLLSVNAAMSVAAHGIQRDWWNCRGLLPDAYSELWADGSVPKILGGTAIFVADALVMLGVYAAALRFKARRSVGVVAAVLAALVLDSVAFPGLLAWIDPNSNYAATVWNHLVTKTLVGIVYSMCLAWAVTGRDAARPQDGGRPAGVGRSGAVVLHRTVELFVYPGALIAVLGVAVIESAPAPNLVWIGCVAGLSVLFMAAFHPFRRDCVVASDAAFLPFVADVIGLNALTGSLRKWYPGPMEDTDDFPADGPNVEADRAARRQYAADLPTLLGDEALLHKWVAYASNRRVPDADKVRQRLYRRCVADHKLAPGAFTLFFVEQPAEVTAGDLR